jgi:hypothetical protein
MAGADRSTLAAWRSATFTDQNSLSVDALLVDPDGADNLLGFVDLAHDGRDDDLHLQSTVGSFHGGSFAPVVNLGTGLPEMLGATLTADAAQSPAIDRGDVASSVAEEPAPTAGTSTRHTAGPLKRHLALSSLCWLRPDGGEVWPAGQVFLIRWRRWLRPTLLTLTALNHDDGRPSQQCVDLGTRWLKRGCDSTLSQQTRWRDCRKDRPWREDKWIFGYNNNYAGGGATFFHQ